jgi:uncharacterized membrane protein
MIAIVLLSLDFLYIYAMKHHYEKQIIDVQRVGVLFRPMGAFISYFLIVFGIYWFIVSRGKSPLEAGILGAVTYGIYNSMNYAILKKWKPQLAVVNTIWGGIMFYATTAVVYTGIL